MPPLAIAGVAAAAIGAGSTLISANKNSKAIKQATQTQQASEAQQLAFQERARAENTAALTPYMARGNAAGDIYSAALGVPGTTAGATGALEAYEIFKKSVGYESRLQEGQRGQGALYAGNGVYQSGARDKALARFNQDYASREFGNWMGGLDNQQRIGFGSASALAGVSQTFADRASDISQSGANFAGQAAVARAQNQGALWSGLANAAGSAVGALSSYKTPTYQTPPYNPALNASVVPSYGYG